jgi:hypothetical protein
MLTARGVGAYGSRGRRTVLRKLASRIIYPEYFIEKTRKKIEKYLAVSIFFCTFVRRKTSGNGHPMQLAEMILIL